MGSARSAGQPRAVSAESAHVLALVTGTWAPSVSRETGAIHGRVERVHRPCFTRCQPDHQTSPRGRPAPAKSRHRSPPARPSPRARLGRPRARGVPNGPRAPSTTDAVAAPTAATSAPSQRERRRDHPPRPFHVKPAHSHHSGVTPSPQTRLFRWRPVPPVQEALPNIPRCQRAPPVGTQYRRFRDASPNSTTFSSTPPQRSMTVAEATLSSSHVTRA